MIIHEAFTHKYLISIIHSELNNWQKLIKQKKQGLNKSFRIPSGGRRSVRTASATERWRRGPSRSTDEDMKFAPRLQLHQTAPISVGKSHSTSAGLTISPSHKLCLLVRRTPGTDHEMQNKYGYTLLFLILSNIVKQNYLTTNYTQNISWSS